MAIIHEIGELMEDESPVVYYENGVFKKYKRFRDIPAFQTDRTETEEKEDGQFKKHRR